MKKALLILMSVVLAFGTIGVLVGCSDKDPNGKTLYSKEYTSKDGKYLYRVGKNTDENDKVLNYYAIITDVLKFDDLKATEFTFPEEVDGYVVEELGYVKRILVVYPYFLSANEIIETIYVPKTVNKIEFGAGKWFFEEWSAKKTFIIQNENFVLNGAIFESKNIIVVVSDKTYEKYKNDYSHVFHYNQDRLILYDEWVLNLENV